MLSRFSALAKKALLRLRYYVMGYRNYWKYTRVPKENELWVFSGFRRNCYMDNAKYFYEYLLRAHPEIRPVWLTVSDEVYANLKAEGKPVLRMDSEAGIACMSRAAVAVTDHFVMTDYSPEWGLNDGTKIVQLWHGVGFKAMGDKNGVRNTTERGVRYSRDILPSPGDGGLRLAYKKLKYRFCAPFREKMETYLVMTDTGPEREETILSYWGVPEEARVKAGNPRVAPLLQTARAEAPAKVLYAPTYRFDAAHEKALIEDFLAHAPAVERLMEERNAVLHLRLHPHTWRDYGDLIGAGLAGFSRIARQQTPDIYAALGEYTALITDYSSIAMDFVGPGRPVIFLCPDFDWFAANEAGFTLDFVSRAPGPVVYSWENAFPLIETYLQNPLWDRQRRVDRYAYFYFDGVNDGHDAARITEAVKRRLEAE